MKKKFHACTQARSLPKKVEIVLDNKMVISYTFRPHSKYGHEKAA